jgi:type II secretion system protein L
MQEWLALLQTWNVQADVIMPTLFGLPLEENTWVVVLQDMAIVRMSAFQGFACDVNNVNELLNIALLATEHAPQQIHIKNYSSQLFTTALNKEMNVKQDTHPDNQLESDLALNALASPYINLMHGAYKSKKSRFPEMHKIWKTAMILSMVWLGLLFLYPAISYLILNQRVSHINEQIAEVYKRNFPQSSSIVAPKLRMQEKLQAYMGHAGESKSLILIATLGKGMNEAKGITVKRLDFQQNRMTLELSAASSQAFSRLTEFMTGHGLTVKQDSANLAGAHVNAIITVE